MKNEERMKNAPWSSFPAFKLQFLHSNSAQKHPFWKNQKLLKLLLLKTALLLFKKKYKSSYDDNHFVVFWSHGIERSDLIFLVGCKLVQNDQRKVI